jgi:L-Ala-D/L-Glu epimerase
MTMGARLTARREQWPIAGAFTIARGSKTAADVVVVTLERDGAVGRGECVPYGRYGETIDGVLAEIEAKKAAFQGDLTHAAIPAVISSRAAQNAIDCALWDLEAKRAGKRVWELLGLPAPEPIVTAFTVSLGAPDAMARAAEAAADRPLLKIKLGGREDAACLRAVRNAVPKTRLIVDANEGWSGDALPAMLDVCASVGVELVEQPLPADDDEALRSVSHHVPICADESAHGAGELESLRGKYDAINIKLDKTGGLTPALDLRRAAERMEFDIMVGCMVSTSLSMAPATLVAQGARVVDLDGPLLLAKDREHGLRYDGHRLLPASAALWG